MDASVVYITCDRNMYQKFYMELSFEFLSSYCTSFDISEYPEYSLDIG